MHRRDFLKMAAAGAAASLAAAGEEPSGRDFYDYRIYRLQPGNSGELLQTYLQKGFLPALKRRGIGPVGVFTQTDPVSTDVHVLIPYSSIDSYLSIASGIDNTGEIRAAVPEWFSEPTKADPAYRRMDSTLLIAMPGQPRLVLPEASRSGSQRIFEIRTYESFSEERNLKKVDMFDSGEMNVQREAGLSPVFYGLALSGSNLPRVVYMLSGPDRAVHRKHWSNFSHDPRWLRAKADPQYANTATHNTWVFVQPTDYSQI